MWRMDCRGLRGEGGRKEANVLVQMSIERDVE